MNEDHSLQARSSLSESAIPRKSASDGDDPRLVLTNVALPSAQFESGACTEVPAMVLIFFAVLKADLNQSTKSVLTHPFLVQSKDWSGVALLRQLSFALSYPLLSAYMCIGLHLSVSQTPVH